MDTTGLWGLHGIYGSGVGGICGFWRPKMAIFKVPTCPPWWRGCWPGGLQPNCAPGSGTFCRFGRPKFPGPHLYQWWGWWGFALTSALRSSLTWRNPYPPHITFYFPEGQILGKGQWDRVGSLGPSLPDMDEGKERFHPNPLYPSPPPLSTSQILGLLPTVLLFSFKNLNTYSLLTDLSSRYGAQQRLLTWGMYI